jgi:alkyl hydroperoxide reductase subunit AhpC
VATTELIALSTVEHEFESRSVKLLVVCMEDLFTILNWLDDVEDVSGSKPTFPFVADENRFISYQFQV